MNNCQRCRTNGGEVNLFILFLQQLVFDSQVRANIIKPRTKQTRKISVGVGGAEYLGRVENDPIIDRVVG